MIEPVVLDLTCHPICHTPPRTVASIL